MLKQIHDSQFTHFDHCNDLRGEAICRFVRSLFLIYSRPFALAAPQRAKAGVISGLIPKSHSRTLFGAEGTRRLETHRTLQKKLFIQNGVYRARHA
jgi:hypothetical protein